MKFSLLFSFLILTSLQLGAQGIEFFEGSWDEALEKAKTEEKVIFVDAYTTWCGPCKRMAKTAFKDEAVGDFYNNNFINMKLNMEKHEGLTFRKKYPVSAFPTLYYIDAKGEVVHTLKGAQKADQLLKLGSFVTGKIDYSADYAKLYEAGDRDPELIYNYVKGLNKSKKSSLKIANEYINSQKDMTTDFNLRFILEAASEADSRIFEMLIKNKSKIESLSSEQEVMDKIYSACERTAQKAIEYQSEDLLNDAKSKMKKHYSSKAKTFAVLADMNYYREMGDAKNYLKCCSDYAKKEVKNDAKKLHTLALEIQENFALNNNAMKQAEKVANKAAENGGLYTYYMTYADILLKNGKKSEALKAAKKSLDLAKENKMAQMSIQRFIQKIEQG